MKKEKTTSPKAVEKPRRMGLEVHRIFETILSDITSGVLLPGTKLNEQEIARSLGVSRGPLREAIRRLEERHLVRCTPNFGTRVIMHTPREVLDAYEIRESLEGMAARLAAQHMTDAEMRDMRADYELEVSNGRSGGYQRDFHMHIVRGSHNGQLIQMLNEDYYRIFLLWRRTCPWLRFGGDQSWNDHKRILEAIEARDGECAEILMRRHISRLRIQSEKELVRITGEEAPLRFGHDAKSLQDTVDSR